MTSPVDRTRFSGTLRACILGSVLLLVGAFGGGCEDDDAEQPEGNTASAEQQAAKRPEKGAEGKGPQAKARGGRKGSARSRGPSMFTRSRGMMGTVFRVAVADAPARKAAGPVRRALDEIGRLEDLLSEWRDESEISRINQAAGKHPVEVSEETLAVVQAGVNVSRWSQGAFDLSWAALRGLYDFRPDRQKIPERREVRKQLRKIDWEAIEIDEQKQTVFLEKDGMAIGTGGIAKGYALDRASEILKDAGLDSFMLFGGGQVQVHGMKGDRPWRVGIQHPRKAQEYFAFFESTGGSISTSGDYEHFFFDDEGTRWHHILDPRDGLPARKSRSVTVMAPAGLYADALSTAAFVLGPKRALRMFREMPYEAELVMLGDECKLHTTPGARDKLRFRIELEDGVLPNCADKP